MELKDGACFLSLDRPGTARTTAIRQPRGRKVFSLQHLDDFDPDLCIRRELHNLLKVGRRMRQPALALYVLPSR